MKEQIGILVMSYGTPASLEDVEAYYTHIRRGRPPAPEQLEDLKSRYEAIGGVSPLTALTKEQIRNLENRLNEREEHFQFKAYSGLKHAHPFIHEAVASMVDDGIRKAVGIVLAPHYSVMSVGTYQKYAIEAAETHGLEELYLVNEYHLEPHFIEAMVNRVEDTLKKFPSELEKEVKILYTAHSLPEKILETGDPYPAQLRETAQMISDKLGHSNWETGWQSAGQTGVPWLGPDILEKMRMLKEEGVTNLIISPIGFVSDHLEVLYDIDIECQQLANELGIHLERTASLNSDPLYIEALSNEVLKQLEHLK
jgi:ferrochelatase